MKKLSIFLTVFCLVTLAGCNKPTVATQPEPVKEKLLVTASFYPLAYLSERIAGDTAIVTQIIPGGVEPHDYEPTPQQMSAVFGAKVFVMNGHGIDPWADKAGDQLRRNGVAVITATEGIDLLPAVEHEHGEDKHEGVEEHMEGTSDPHVWLDPVQMQAIAVRLRDAFIAADSTNEEIYGRNADSLIADLKALDARFQVNVEECTQTKAIVSHNAFRYMARRYGFETLALAGLSPDEEPSPKKMAEIIETAKREKLKVVFFETLVSPKLAQSVAKGSGAKSLVLNPIEGLTPDNVARGDTYLSIMQNNADNLSIALECQK